jgi:hypothetical protein
LSGKSTIAESDMKEGRQIEPEKIHMVSLKTLQGNISGDNIDPKSIKGYTYDFIVGTGIDAEQKIVGIELTVGIKAIGLGDKELPVSGSYKHEAVYHVENLEDFIDLQESEQPPILDSLMNATLIGIAFSTVRGIIFSRTQGTLLNTVILPVVDPKKLANSNEIGAEKD